MYPTIAALANLQYTHLLHFLTSTSHVFLNNLSDTLPTAATAALLFISCEDQTPQQVSQFVLNQLAHPGVGQPSILMESVHMPSYN